MKAGGFVPVARRVPGVIISHRLRWVCYLLHERRVEVQVFLRGCMRGLYYSHKGGEWP